MLKIAVYSIRGRGFVSVEKSPSESTGKEKRIRSMTPVQAGRVSRSSGAEEHLGWVGFVMNDGTKIYAGK